MKTELEQSIVWRRKLALYYVFCIVSLKPALYYVLLGFLSYIHITNPSYYSKVTFLPRLV